MHWVSKKSADAMFWEPPCFPTHAINKTRLLDYLINGLMNRHKNWYDAMPHITKPLKFRLDRLTLTPVRVFREKLQQDRQTHTETDRHKDRHRRIVQNHFSRRFEGSTSQIRSYLEVDFLHNAMGHGSNTSSVCKLNLFMTSNKTHQF